MAVKGLYGCTAVVVISRQGAWAGHFWEETFKTENIIPTLRTGKGQKYYNQYGLAKLRNNEAITEGRIFDDVNKPHIYIVAPRKRVNLPNGDKDNSESAGGDILADEKFVNSMKIELQSIFGEQANILPTIMYSPMRIPPTSGDFGDNAFESHRGKLLIQYQPSQGSCRPEAQWRVWFEGSSKYYIK